MSAKGPSLPIVPPAGLRDVTGKFECALGRGYRQLLFTSHARVAALLASLGSGDADKAIKWRARSRMLLHLGAFTRTCLPPSYKASPRWSSAWPRAHWRGDP